MAREVSFFLSLLRGLLLGLLPIYSLNNKYLQSVFQVPDIVGNAGDEIGEQTDRLVILRCSINLPSVLAIHSYINPVICFTPSSLPRHLVRDFQRELMKEEVPGLPSSPRTHCSFRKGSPLHSVTPKPLSLPSQLKNGGRMLSYSSQAG